MTRLDKQEFWEWAYGDLFTNTTRGVLAEYIVATALDIADRKRVEWDQYDLEIDGVGVEVKSAAYVQAWDQARASEVTFNIRRAQGWVARDNTYADSARRSAGVYVFCLLDGQDREQIDPLEVSQWKFYVLATSELDRHVPTQKTIRLNSLISLGPRQCIYEDLEAAIREAVAGNPSSDGIPANP